VHGVSTNSARAQPSKQNNRHVLSMCISLKKLVDLKTGFLRIFF
jgi:hypothetical protein